MKVTMQKIAELAGTSRGTVDRVLNNRGRVDETVAERVRIIASEQGYQTRTEKKAAPDHRRLGGRKIGVVTILSRASFMISIRKGLLQIQNEARMYGVEVIIKETENAEEKSQLAAIRELEQEGIHALALMPIDCDSVRAELQHLIHDLKIPVVSFNTDIVGTDRLCFVGMDNRKAGRAAAGLVGTLMRNSGSCLGIIGSFSNRACLLRIEGFTAELARNFPEIEITGVSPSMDQQSMVEEIVTKAICTQPDLGSIMIVSSGQEGIRDAFRSEEVKAALRHRDIEHKGERPFVIMYDFTPKNQRLLDDGVADFVIDQDGFSQGYHAVLTLINYMNTGEKPEEFLFTNITMRTKYTS